MDTRIVNLLDTLPPYFRGATPPADHINDSKVMECLLIQLIGETRLLRLHRPYLSRGYRDRKYAPSKERCVNSARSILVLLKTAEKASPILLGQWLTLFYGFGAVGLVLCGNDVFWQFANVLVLTRLSSLSSISATAKEQTTRSLLDRNANTSAK